MEAGHNLLYLKVYSETYATKHYAYPLKNAGLKYEPFHDLTPSLNSEQAPKHTEEE